MSKKNLPNIPIYIGDWERDCNVLSLESEMAWMKIIFKMHLSGKQSTYKTSAKGLQILWKNDANKVKEIMDELLFNDICEIVEVPGGFEFFSRRIQKENDLSLTRSESAKSRFSDDKQTECKSDAKVMQNTDYDNDSEVDNENESKNDSANLIPAGKIKIDFEEIANIFNSVCLNLPRVTKLTEKRKTLIKARINENSLEIIGQVFIKVSQSDFLNGDNKNNWKADFEWVLNPNNFIKILEDNYKNKPNGRQQKSTTEQFNEAYNSDAAKNYSFGK